MNKSNKIYDVNNYENIQAENIKYIWFIFSRLIQLCYFKYRKKTFFGKMCFLNPH